MAQHDNDGTTPNKKTLEELLGDNLDPDFSRVNNAIDTPGSTPLPDGWEVTSAHRITDSESTSSTPLTQEGDRTPGTHEEDDSYESLEDLLNDSPRIEDHDEKSTSQEKEDITGTSDGGNDPSQIDGDNSDDTPGSDKDTTPQDVSTKDGDKDDSDDADTENPNDDTDHKDDPKSREESDNPNKVTRGVDTATGKTPSHTPKNTPSAPATKNDKKNDAKTPAKDNKNTGDGTKKTNEDNVDPRKKTDETSQNEEFDIAKDGVETGDKKDDNPDDDTPRADGDKDTVKPPIPSVPGLDSGAPKEPHTLSPASNPRVDSRGDGRGEKFASPFDKNGTSTTPTSDPSSSPFDYAKKNPFGKNTNESSTKNDTKSNTKGDKSKTDDGRPSPVQQSRRNNSDLSNKRSAQSMAKKAKEVKDVGKLATSAATGNVAGIVTNTIKVARSFNISGGLMPKNKILPLLLALVLVGLAAVMCSVPGIQEVTTPPKACPMGSSTQEIAGQGESSIPEGEYAHPMDFSNEQLQKDYDAAHACAAKNGNNFSGCGIGGLSTAWGQRGGEWHDGFDLAYQPHGAPVYAVYEGDVIRTYHGCADGAVDSCGGGYGNVVIIHSQKDGIDFMTLYGHNTESLVENGDHVYTGQEIARVGNSGASYGAHVHFNYTRGTTLQEVYGRAEDPLEILLAGHNVSGDNDSSSRRVKESALPGELTLGSNTRADSRAETRAEGRVENREELHAPLSERIRNVIQRDTRRDVRTVRPAAEDKGDNLKVDGDGDVIKHAREKIGAEYIYGAAGKYSGHGNAYDCSGFVYASYHDAGIPITARSTGQMYNYGEVVYDRQQDGGTVDDFIDRLEPGDIVLYGAGGEASIHHAALYIGHGKVWHSSTEGVPLGPTEEGVPVNKAAVEGAERIIRIKGVTSDGAGGSVDRDPSARDQKGACCMSGDTLGSKDGKNKDKDNREFDGKDPKKNAAMIKKIGKKMGITDNGIAAAIAISMERTGMQNAANRGEKTAGTEDASREEIQKSLDAAHEQINNEGSNIGIFGIPAGMAGGVDDMMDPQYQAEYIFGKMKDIPDYDTKDFNSIGEALGLGGKDYNKYNDAARKYLDSIHNDTPVSDTHASNTASTTDTSGSTDRAITGTLIIGDENVAKKTKDIKKKFAGMMMVTSNGKTTHDAIGDARKRLEKKDSGIKRVMIVTGLHGGVTDADIADAKKLQEEHSDVDIMLSTVPGDKDSTERVRSSGLKNIDLANRISDEGVVDGHYTDDGLDKMVTAITSSGLNTGAPHRSGKTSNIKAQCSDGGLHNGSGKYNVEDDIVNKDDIPDWVLEAVYEAIEIENPGDKYKFITPLTLVSLMKVETTTFSNTACSGAGACGIAQFMPDSWRGNAPAGYEDPKYRSDPKLSARAMISHLKHNYDYAKGLVAAGKYPDDEQEILEGVISGYNGGPAHMDWCGGSSQSKPNCWPKESVDYWKLFVKASDIYSGKREGPFTRQLP